MVTPNEATVREAAALGYALAPASVPITLARLRALAAQQPVVQDRVALDLLGDWLEQIR